MSKNNVVEMMISKNDYRELSPNELQEPFCSMIASMVDDEALINLKHEWLREGEQDKLLDKFMSKRIPFFCYIEGENPPSMLVYSAKKNMDMVIEVTHNREFFIVATESGGVNCHSQIFLRIFLNFLNEVKAEIKARQKELACKD